MLIVEQVRKFRRLSISEKLLFILTLAMMTMAAATIWLIPIRHIARHLGEPLGAVGFTPLTSPVASARARKIRDGIGRAAAILPLRADCYPQALAGQALCRLFKVPVAMHLGVRLGDAHDMEAHAWLLSGRIAITGRAGYASYTPLACFLSN